MDLYETSTELESSASSLESRFVPHIPKTASLIERTYKVTLPPATEKLSDVYRDTNLNVGCIRRDYDIKDVLNATIAKEKLDDPFFVVDLGTIIRKYREWKRLLPNVTPHYAVKCNPKLVILKCLADLGVNFDCASKGEIDAVLALGVEPSRIIYANPCKQISHLRYAKAVGVDLMTFDSLNELHKIKTYFPRARLLLRIKTDDSKSVCQLSCKFGIAGEEAHKLLRLAKSLKLDVVGVSFHVGSGCLDAGAFAESLNTTALLCDQAADMGFDFKIIDIGGGFPGTEMGRVTFASIAKVLVPVLKERFPTMTLIAEPGRFFVAASHVLCTAVIGKKEISDEETKTLYKRLNLSDLTTKAPDRFLYYLNDGVYASFNNIIYDHAVPQAHSLFDRGPSVYRCTLFGPTCDGLDTISKGTLLPELSVSDWVYFPNMGAYTVCAASIFNGFELSPIYYINSEA